MKNIAIFASGSGTNAENIIRWFENNPHYRVNLVLCNNPDAYVLTRAKNLNIKSISFLKKDLYENHFVEESLQQHNTDYIILAGFLLKMPITLTERYKDRIINIHPALLPKYGGKGMYGMNVHKAVIDNKETKSGITIHLVDEKYDNGHILFQSECTISKEETPESLAQKIHLLEQKHFPKEIEKYLMTQPGSDPFDDN